MLLIFTLIILILILTIILNIKNENFSLSMGRFLRFAKENKFDDRLTDNDIDLINDIKKCYENKNTYYDCINRLRIPYLRNPVKVNKYKKEIDYLKHKTTKHLLPFDPYTHNY